MRELEMENGEVQDADSTVPYCLLCDERNPERDTVYCAACDTKLVLVEPGG
jgi:uncharacterized paraquat-inducible protein A